MPFSSSGIYEIETAREYIAQNRQWIPQLAFEMEEIMRIGVTANYQRPPPVDPRRRGLPYKDGETLEIVGKLRPDIQNGGMFLRGTASVGGDTSQVETAPSTLVPKRNPDRSRSSEKERYPT